MRLDNLDSANVQWAEGLLNNRFRKVLGYLTPFEAMASTTVFTLHIILESAILNMSNILLFLSL